MKSKILVIEDDERIAELILRGISGDDYDVTVKATGTEGLSSAFRERFDLVITDIILPGINGIDICKELKKLDETYPVIILTALGTTDDKVDGFDAGADDYMVKPFEIRELLARINALLKRSKLIKSTDPILKIADLDLNTKTKVVKRKGIELDLTPKEFNLMVYLLENRDRVIPKAEIAEKVWNIEFDTGTNFIDVYISYLRKKIDKGHEIKLIHTKSGMGYILKEGNEYSE